MAGLLTWSLLSPPTPSGSRTHRLLSSPGPYLHATFPSYPTSISQHIAKHFTPPKPKSISGSLQSNAVR